MSRVVFVLAPRVHLLDLAGPAQVFGTAADLGHRYDLAYVADTPHVASAQGLTLNAALDWPALTRDDLVVVPGWRAATLARSGRMGSATLARIAAHHAAGGVVAGVCVGADALGRAGLLDGRRCTTHHDVRDELARRFPRAQVVRDVPYVEDGRVVTSAGVTGGIDLALHLVAVRHGPAAAARVAGHLVAYARHTGQAGATLRHRAHLSDPVHRVQDRIDAEFTRTLTLAELAATAGVSERTLTRLFTAAIGQTPLRYQQLLRVERAEHLISQGATVESAARTVGFSDARMLRRLRGRGL
ncbi:GlxA family transcriptional regulator [Krasilnikovia sp. MM14-A1259]|uniref:GlxA family transcriptional regulator n=1 Tax=Krasilnikovia sp. MM14-A1259 TaxID=3373539 RepID=UPI0038196F11